MNRILLSSLFALALFLFSFVESVHSQAVGVPWVGDMGAQESTAQIMERDRVEKESGIQKPLLIRSPHRADRQHLPQNPDSTDAAQFPPSREATQTERPRSAANTAVAVRSPSPKLPQTQGLQFTGATLADTGYFPPDTMGVVGPSQFLIGINGRVRVFDKTTGAIGSLDADMDVFFNSVRNGYTTSDPRVRYDRLSGRWFVTIINVTDDASGNILGPNRVLIAVSNNGTITSGTVWTFFYFQQEQVSPAGDSTCFSDYPTLGIDANALYIGVNQFCGIGTAGNYGGAAGFVIRKSSVLGAGPIVVAAFRNLTGTPTGAGPYTPQGVDNFDPGATEGYFIGVDNANYGLLQLRRISNPGGTPSISANIPITVNATSAPVLVPHKGSTGGNNGRLDSLDDRLFAAHFRNGRLWTAQNIGVNASGSTSSANRCGSRWYELQNLSGTPSVVESGTLYDPTTPNNTSQRNYWIPTIMVSGQGHAALGCSTAGSNEYANAFATGRLKTDALGTLENTGVPASSPPYTSSSTAYNPPGDTGSSTGRRWGDFSFTSLDPCDDMTMWTIQEFCNAANSYGIRAVKLIAPPPSTPASCAPPSVMAGQSSVSVMLTGTSSGGSGFYDPGPAFGCRLAAIVSGGDVVVNGITFADSTHLTLNLSTVGSAPGLRSVTIVNPDGQQRTSAAGILTISPGPTRTATPTATRSATRSPTPTPTPNEVRDWEFFE